MPAPFTSRIKTALSCAGRQLQKGDTAAGQEADNWQQNASSWCAALLQQHPLYRDLVQPMALAVYEVRCGLSLLRHAASARPEQLLADAVLADCMALPSRLGQGDFQVPKVIHVPLLASHNLGGANFSPPDGFLHCIFWVELLAFLCSVAVK